MKGGNYTFEGVFKNHLENVFQYLNMRLKSFIYKRIIKYLVELEDYCKRSIFFAEFSIKYVVIDPAKVTEYGLFGAVRQYLDKKVIKTIRHLHRLVDYINYFLNYILRKLISPQPPFIIL